MPTAPMPETASWLAAPVLVGVAGDPAAAPGCPAAFDGNAIDDALEDALCDADAIGNISIACTPVQKQQRKQQRELAYHRI